MKSKTPRCSIYNVFTIIISVFAIYFFILLGILIQRHTFFGDVHVKTPTPFPLSKDQIVNKIPSEGSTKAAFYPSVVRSEKEDPISNNYIGKELNKATPAPSIPKKYIEIL